MLKLVRRPLIEFLSTDQQDALARRVSSAAQLSARTDLTAEEKSKRINSQWDAFRAGRTSAGTFASLWGELCDMTFHKCAFCEVSEPDTVEHLQEKSKMPARAFDWSNLLSACSSCNRTRENSGVATLPIDPSDVRVEPLDYFGWDEYGDFAPDPGHAPLVADLVSMYGLHRFREERRAAINVFRGLLSSLIREDAESQETVDALRLVLSPTKAWLGPIRDYLLRPPTESDELLVRGALRLLPEIRTLVQPWLRPPPWAPNWWR